MRVLILRSIVFTLCFFTFCFSDVKALNHIILNFMDRSQIQVVGVSARRNADSQNILVNYEESVLGGKLDILELFIDKKVSFYVINRNPRVSKGSFEKLETFIRTKNAKKAVEDFLETRIWIQD